MKHRLPDDLPVIDDPIEDPWGRRDRMHKKPDWLAIAMASLSIITTLGAWVWWGGRLSQRVDTLEAQMQEDRRGMSDITGDNGRQNVAIGIIGQQYGEINRRLDGIDRKLDKR